MTKDRSPEVPKGVSDNAPTLLLTPGGLRAANRVISVDGDSAVRLRPGNQRSRLGWKGPLFTQLTRSNWIVASYCEGDTVSDFTAEITVPAEPVQHSGQLIYLFTGLQDEAATMILQPVLQWGQPGDPPGWQLCSWVVDQASGFVHLSRQTAAVAPGTHVCARIQMTARRGNRFDYKCWFEGKKETLLAIESVPPLKTSVIVLEAYGIQEGNDYPPDPPVRFENVRIVPSRSSNWSIQDMVIDYGQHIDIVANKEPYVFDIHCRQ